MCSALLLVAPCALLPPLICKHLRLERTQDNACREQWLRFAHRSLRSLHEMTNYSSFTITGCVRLLGLYFPEGSAGFLLETPCNIAADIIRCHVRAFASGSPLSLGRPPAATARRHRCRTRKGDTSAASDRSSLNARVQPTWARARKRVGKEGRGRLGAQGPHNILPPAIRGQGTLAGSPPVDGVVGWGRACSCCW